MKLGGFPIVSKFLSVSDPEVIRMAAEIIGISCQNHPQCQKAVIDDPNIFINLFSILQSNQLKDGVKLKAVFAISCKCFNRSHVLFYFINIITNFIYLASIQNNPNGHDKFKKLNGYDIFLNVLKTADIPLRLRICFVFDCLCSQFPDIKCKYIILLSKINEE